MNKFHEILLDEMRKSVSIASSKGLIEKKEEEKYFASVTENEVNFGLLNKNMNKDKTNDNCIAFFREISSQKILNEKNKKGVKIYTDDYQSNDILSKLRSNVREKLIKENVFDYKVNLFCIL